MSNIFDEGKSETKVEGQLDTTQASSSIDFDLNEFSNGDFNGISDIISALGKFSGTSLVTTLGAQVSSMFEQKFNEVLTGLQFPDSVYDLVKKELPTLIGQLKGKIVNIVSSFKSPMDLLANTNKFDDILSTDNIKTVILDFVKEKVGDNPAIEVITDLAGGSNE